MAYLYLRGELHAYRVLLPAGEITYRVVSNRYNDPGRWLFPSGQWLMLGLRHRRRTSEFVPLKDIAPEWLSTHEMCWQKGTPQWCVEDLDHGTRRQWGEKVRVLMYCRGDGLKDT